MNQRNLCIYSLFTLIDSNNVDPYLFTYSCCFLFKPFAKALSLRAGAAETAGAGRLGAAGVGAGAAGCAATAGAGAGVGAGAAGFSSSFGLPRRRNLRR